MLGVPGQEPTGTQEAMGEPLRLFNCLIQTKKHSPGEKKNLALLHQITNHSVFWQLLGAKKTLQGLRRMGQSVSHTQSRRNLTGTNS